jgi:hypothetical protein
LEDGVHVAGVAFVADPHEPFLLLVLPVELHLDCQEFVEIFFEVGVLDEAGPAAAFALQSECFEDTLISFCAEEASHKIVVVLHLQFLEGDGKSESFVGHHGQGQFPADLHDFVLMSLGLAHHYAELLEHNGACGYSDPLLFSELRLLFFGDDIANVGLVGAEEEFEGIGFLRVG